jgi:translocation and assembly module TamB
MNKPSHKDKNKDIHLSEQPEAPLPKSSFWRRKLVWGAGILLLTGAGAGLTFGWFWLQRKLIPLVETELTNYFDRPVDIGQLQILSPLGARFGQSEIPPTATNPDTVSVEAVWVNFDPWKLLSKRTLELNLTLVKPDLYLEQDERRIWTPADFGSPEEDEEPTGLKVEVDTIKIQEGEITLLAWNKETAKLNPPVKGRIDWANVNFLNGGNSIEFQLAGQLVEGGTFTVNGKGIPKTEDIDLVVVGDRLAAKEVSNLLALPVELQAGKVGGNLAVQLRKKEAPQLKGTATLKEVKVQIPELVKPFSQSTGKLHFDGTEITFDSLNTFFGEIAGKVNGSLNTDETKGEYRLSAKTQPAEIDRVVEALELEKPPIPITGKIRGNVEMTGPLSTPKTRFEIVNTTPSRIDKVDFQTINSNLELIGTNLLVREFEAIPQAGGRIEGTGKIELDGEQNLAFEVRAKDISGKAIASNYNQKLPVDLGLISGQAQFLAKAGNLESLRVVNSSASFPLGGGIVSLTNLKYTGKNWQTNVRASAVQFASLPVGKNSPPTVGQGRLDGQFQVFGQSDSFELERIRATGKANLETVGGQIVVPSLELAAGRWLADLTTENLQLKRLFPEIPPEFEGLVSGKMALTGEVQTQPEQEEKIDGSGNLNLAEGTVAVSDFRIRGNNWNTTIQANALQLNKLNSGVPNQFAGLVDGNFYLEGNVDKIAPEAIRAKGDGSLTLPEGVFDATNLVIAKGRFNTSVIPRGVDLSLFGDPASDALELKGKLGGQLNVTGGIDKISPAAVEASGQLSFSEGIDLIEQPFEAAIHWNGKRLDVLQAKGEGLDARGFVELDKSFFENIPDKLAAIAQFQFDVDRAQWLDINKLRLTLPSWATNLDYFGKADFQGKIGGIPAQMNIDGDLTLRNFSVENLAFAPALQGTVKVIPQQGTNLQLAQGTDQIELVLDRENVPVSFLLEHDDISVTGRGKGEVLEITTTNFPVDLLKTIAVKSDDFAVPANIAAQPFSGQLSGDFSFNLDTLSASGKNVEIVSPVLSRIKGDRLTGNFQYADGYVALQNGRFQQRNSIYQLEGSLVQKQDDLELQADVQVEQGEIQDILIALELFELSDLAQGWGDRQYAKAKDLYEGEDKVDSIDRETSSSPTPPTPLPPLFTVGLPNASTLDQVSRLAEIRAWLAMERQRRQENSFLPELVSLEGSFDGTMTVAGSLAEGIKADFDFQGQQWQWDSFTADKIQVAGTFENDILTLLPILVSSENSSIVFSGSFGGETQSGQLRLIDVPFALIEKFVSLPPEINFGGLINATATLAGSPANPQGRGEITLADAKINQTSVQSTQGSFSYNNARFNFFASSVVANNAEPLTITGSIPYQLPFATVAPDNNQLNLNLNVQNEGLALLNILTRGEVNWIDGQGDITIDLAGTFDSEKGRPSELVAKGTATVNNGTIAARVLPDAFLTDVNGKILFDLDRLQVENFQGNFGGGKVSAMGTLPLTKTTPQADPLTINLDNLAIDLKGFYKGGIKGKVEMLGSAVEPVVAGELSLFDGTVLLGSLATPSNGDLSNGEGRLTAVPELRDLKLELGNNIQISQPPIFNFLATGTLKVGGTVNQPRPEGAIALKRGQVNLFTTQLSLANSSENTARFSRNNGLDPYLDVSLVGSAVETTRSPIPNDPLSSEISDIPSFSFGTLEPIRISARVKGLASQLTNSIELTSSPPRTETEILALLGGGFVNTLGRGDSTLGLANLAGSALFGSFQTAVGDVFDLGDFRLFPTQIIDENRERKQIVGLAAEAALDFTNQLSLSALKILNTDIPAQIGLRYRLNDRTVLRGLTNFEDDSRVVIEYEQRF